MRRSQSPLDRRKGRAGLLFLTPWLIGVVFLFGIPLLQSFRFSLSKLELAEHGFTLTFVGFQNYATALTENAAFNRMLTDALVGMVVDVPLIIIFSLFAAVLLNQKFVGRALARAIFFLPVILASGVIAELSQTDFLMARLANETSNTDFSILRSFELKDMLMKSGINHVIVNYLTEAVNRIYQIVSASGVQILIFLAGLQSISASLYEASKIEGATGYEAFWKITFPMVSPLILTNVVFTVINSFTGSPITKMIHQTAFDAHKFGLSAAMSWLYFAVVIVCLWILVKIISKKVFYYD